ncbi:hypothetical protein GCM10027402_30880 [Arthrobacter monumenti]
MLSPTAEYSDVGQFKIGDNFAKPLYAPLEGFDQRHCQVPAGDRQGQARKSCTTAYICYVRFAGNELPNDRTIEDVPTPQLGDFPWP